MVMNIIGAGGGGGSQKVGKNLRDRVVGSGCGIWLYRGVRNLVDQNPTTRQQIQDFNIQPASPKMGDSRYWFHIHTLLYIVFRD